MRQILNYRPRLTTLWLVLATAVVAGLALGRGVRGCGWQLVLASAVLAALSLRRRTWLTVLFIAAGGLLLGLWRGGSFGDAFNAYAPLYGQKVMFEVTAMDDGVYGSGNRQYQMVFDAGSVRLADGERLPDKIEVAGFGLNSVFQGDDITVSGKLYSGIGSYAGFVSYGELSLDAHHPTLVANLRRKFTAGMQTALPEPLAPFAMGLLIGQRATLPADVKQDLLRVGLTHIIAVSGYNLTIMLDASRRLLAKRSKRLSVALSLSLIGLFLLFAGASASIIRAALVSVLSIWAAYYGRGFKPLNLIMLAAAATAYANPVYLWSDASWYLSFLAFFGVMVLSPLIEARFVPARLRQSALVAIALESACAELMSTPYILYEFGQMSFIGLPANMLVTVFVPLAMLLSLIAGLAGMLLLPVAGWLSWPARWLLTYMLDTAHLLASVPHSFVQNLSLKVGALLGYYVLLAGFILVLRFKLRSQTGIITDKNERIG